MIRLASGNTGNRTSVWDRAVKHLSHSLATRRLIKMPTGRGSKQWPKVCPKVTTLGSEVGWFN